MNKKCAVVVLNWNGHRDTVECVKSCLKLSYPNLEIVIVDNGSTDCSSQVIPIELPEATFIETEANLGFAGGNNVGIRYALDNGADFVWLLNNDTVVDTDALSALVDVATTDQSVGILGSKIFFYDKPGFLNTAGGKINWKTGQPSLIGFGEKDDGRFDTMSEVETVSGCSLFVKREVIERIGVMDERFFLYFEETDWVVRARKSGYKIVFVPTSKIWHKVSASTGGHESVGMKYYMARNNLLFMKKNASPRQYYFFLCHYLLNLMPREVGRMLLCNKQQRLLKAKAIVLGVFHYFKGTFGQYTVS